jgi:glycosyltransferase involved in cell wall biosynthesis
MAAEFLLELGKKMALTTAKKQTSPLLSVIIPCLGHAPELRACLAVLQKQRERLVFEVLVVDSASNPEVEAVVAAFPQIHLIRSEAGLSPGAARNLGVRHATGDGLAFLDADCIPAPDWVDQAWHSLQAGMKIIGGPVLDVRPNHPIAWADNHLQFADFQAGRPTGPGTHFPSCNLVMHRATFESLGGFPTGIPTGEDALLSQRAVALYPDEMFYNPALIVRHWGRQTWRELVSHQSSLGFHRASLGLFLGRSYLRLGRHPVLAGWVILRRWAYVSLRTFQYDRSGLWRLFLYLPWVLVGLIAWTVGFYSGMQLPGE